jgi:hypothetical protein
MKKPSKQARSKQQTEWALLVCTNCVVAESWSGYSEGSTWFSVECGIWKHQWVCVYGPHDCHKGSAWSLYLHLVAEAETKALAYRLRVIGLWSGRGLDVGHDQIIAWLTELEPVFQMRQNKTIPVTAFWTSFKVWILSCRHQISTCLWHFSLFSIQMNPG